MNKLIQLVGLCALLLQATPVHAQLSSWKLGGSGLPWSQQDTVRIMLDAESVPGSIQPVYIEPETNIISDRKSTRLNSSHSQQSRMPSSA